VSSRKKISNLIGVILDFINNGKFLDTRHASDRKNERNILRSEVLYVLKNGYHEKKKDKYDCFYNSWNYAVRGKSIDGRDLRIVVSFDDHMLIITAIELFR
jgi:hypothetical protein